MGQGHWAKACAVALVVMGTTQASAQEDNAAKAAARRLQAYRGVTAATGAGEAERRIEATLREPLRSPMDFIETPLSAIMQVIAEEYDLPIQFDESALEAVAQSPDTEVTLNVRGDISLRSVLDLMFKRTEDLTYMIDHEVLLITTEDEANSRLEVRVYRVDDLLVPEGEGGAFAGEEDYDTLVDTIVANIEVDSWMENGTGEGEIQPFAPGMLVISQTRRVHEQVGQLFETLRAVKTDVLADAAANDGENKLVTRGVAIDEDVAKSGVAQTTIRDALMRAVDWTAASEDLGDQVSLDVLPTRVIVRHKRPIVRRVLQTVHHMSLEPKASGPKGFSGGGFDEKPAGGASGGGLGGGGGFGGAAGGSASDSNSGQGASSQRSPGLRRGGF